MENLSNMVAVSKDEFVPGAILPADLFIKIGNENFTLIARQGTKFVFDDFHVSERAEVTMLYIRRDDYKKCVNQHIEVAGIILNSNKVSDMRKTDFIAKATETVFNEISHLGFNQESLTHAKAMASNMQMLISSREDIYNVMNALQNISNELIRHSVAVSMISVVIAKELGWILPMNLEKLSLGALLHDIGLKEIPKEIVLKPRHEMTYEEVQIYENHAFRGMEIVRTMPSIPSDIVSIIHEHHENAIGQGYPRKMRDLRLNPLGRVVAIADCFAELTLANANYPTPLSAPDAINYIEVIMGQPYNKTVFMALKNAAKNNLKKSA